MYVCNYQVNIHLIASNPWNMHSMCKKI